MDEPDGKWRLLHDYGPVTAGRFRLLLCRLGFHRDKGGLGLSWCSECHKERLPPLKRQMALQPALEALAAGDIDRVNRIFEAAVGEKSLL